MSAKKSDLNTSKTAHVMNLLSRGHSAPVVPDSGPAAEAAGQPKPDETPAAGAAAPAAQAAPAPSSTPPASPRSSPIISIMNADASASASIKEALEASLLDDLANAEKAESAPAEPAPAAETPEPVPDEPVPAAEIPEPVPDEPTPAEEIPEPVPAEPAPVAESLEPVPTEPAPEAESLEPVPTEPAPVADIPAAKDEIPFSIVNVMELLVEESADRYIRMFGLCDCARCRADVIAAALTNLPPKYIVMPEHERSARMSIYQGRYSSAVTAQILHACKMVLDDPHHDLH